MKPFTKEQFEIIKDWVWAARLNCTHDAMHSIEQHAYDLLVNDSEPEKTPPSDVNPFFPYLESQDLKTHWNNPVDTVITSSEEPISWNGLKIYNPETHMLVPRVWSEEEWSKITVEIFNHSSARTWPSKPIEDIHYAITKVFGGDK